MQGPHRRRGVVWGGMYGGQTAIRTLHESHTMVGQIRRMESTEILPMQPAGSSTVFGRTFARSTNHGHAMRAIPTSTSDGLEAECAPAAPHARTPSSCNKPRPLGDGVLAHAAPRSGVSLGRAGAVEPRGAGFGAEGRT